MAQPRPGLPAAGETLVTLSTQKYFTTKRAGSPPTYVYHPLFREFLLSRAARAYSPERRAKIRRTAASRILTARRGSATAEPLLAADDGARPMRMVHRPVPALPEL